MSEYDELFESELYRKNQEKIVYRSEQLRQNNKPNSLYMEDKENRFVRIKNGEKVKRQYIRFYKLNNATIMDKLDLSIVSSPFITLFSVICSVLIPVTYFMERTLVIPSGWVYPSEYGKIHGTKAVYIHGTVFADWLVSHTAGWTIWLSIPVLIILVGASYYMLVKRLKSEKIIKKFEEHLWKTT